MVPGLVFGLGIHVNWSANTETDLAGYKVYYGTVAGSYGAPIDVGKVTSHDIGNLLDSITYYVAISAYDTSGNESAKSAEASILMPDRTPPAAPGTPIIVSGVKSLAVSWTTVATAATYKLYYGTVAGVYGTPVIVTGTSYTLSNLLDNTTYYISISAVDASGNESTKSVEISSKTKDTTPPTAPGKPTLTIWEQIAAFFKRLFGSLA